MTETKPTVRELQFAVPLPLTLAKVLWLLLNNTVVSLKVIEEDEKIATNGKVAICRLRRKLAAIDVEITNQRKLGYRISDSDKARIKELADTGQLDFAFTPNEAKNGDSAV
jgi:hypothetical protein